MALQPALALAAVKTSFHLSISSALLLQPLIIHHSPLINIGPYTFFGKEGCLV